VFARRRCGVVGGHFLFGHLIDTGFGGSAMGKTKKKKLDITIAIVSTCDGNCIVNAANEEDAYEAVTGETYPVDGPDEDLEWDCLIVTLEPQGLIYNDLLWLG
jgi:hypothetical protein